MSSEGFHPSFHPPLTKTGDLQAKGIAYEAVMLLDLSCPHSQRDCTLGWLEKWEKWTEVSLINNNDLISVVESRQGAEIIEGRVRGENTEPFVISSFIWLYEDFFITMGVNELLVHFPLIMFFYVFQLCFPQKWRIKKNYSNWAHAFLIFWILKQK